MKVIYRPRSAGKTTELIKAAADYNGYIVCADRERIKNIMKIANDINVGINFPLTFDEFINKQYCAAGIKKVLIDDVDQLLQMITNVPIKVVTISQDEREDDEEWCNINPNIPKISSFPHT